MALRVTQVYVSVLGFTETVVEVNAESSVILTPEATHDLTYSADGESSVVLASDSTAAYIATISADTSLTIIESAGTGTYERNSLSLLEFEEDSDVQFVTPLVGTSPLTIIQDAQPDYFPPVVSQLDIQQTVVFNQVVPVDAEHNLSDTGNILEIEGIVTEDNVGLRGTAEVLNSYAVSAESTLEITQVARPVFEYAESTLTISQDGTADFATNIASNSIELQQTAGLARADLLGAESELEIQHAARFVYEADTSRCYYSPFIGESTNPNAPEPPPAELPAVSELTGFRLLYPSAGSPADEVLLRAPNLGNTDRISGDRINRETRGGTLIVFADLIWPKVETLVLSFSALKREVAHELLDFMRDHLGEEIRLIDWEDRAWTGVITNPQNPVVEDSQGSFTASFEFEGEREAVGV